MRVYVESNFVLELVLEQEQHQACEEILALAASRTIELVLPTLCSQRRDARRRTIGVLPWKMR